MELTPDANREPLNRLGQLLQHRLSGDYLALRLSKSLTYSLVAR